MLVNSFHSTYQRYKTASIIKELSCFEDSVFYLDDSNVITKLELPHLEHSRNSMAGFAGGVSVLFILVIALYHFKKESDRKQRIKAGIDERI